MLSLYTMRNLIMFSLCTVALCGCSCERGTRNVVADKETRLGIDGVQVLSVAASDGRQRHEQYTYTDTSGIFEAKFSASGIAKCPILKVTLTKSGYITERIVDPRIGDTIFMQRTP
jgi:hypothetical protein